MRSLCQIIVARAHRHQEWLHALTLIAAFCGFALVGNDTMQIWSHRQEKPSPTNQSPPRPTGSFPAPTEARAWAEAIATCAQPGPRIAKFVESFEGNKAQRMAQIYDWTAQHWSYEADQDQDWLTPAESLFEPGMLRGDCKNLAVLFAASSAQLGIASRIIATRGLDGRPGHVQTQALICRPGEDPTSVLDTMTAVWRKPGQTTEHGKADLPLVLTKEGWYLALDGGPQPRHVDKLGPPEVVVSFVGRITK